MKKKVLNSLFALLPACAFAQTATAPEGIPVTVEVNVHNTLTGEPVSDAFVQLHGYQPARDEALMTDAWGRVVIENFIAPGGRVRAFAPLAALGLHNANGETSVDGASYVYLQLWTTSVGQYSTGLIDKDVGGIFTFNGNIEAAVNTTDLWFRLRVPPNAYPEDFIVWFDPLPGWAQVHGGEAEPDTFDIANGTFHLSIRDAAGNELDGNLAAPVWIDYFPWVFPSGEWGSPAFDPEDEYYQCYYNEMTHTYELLTTDVYVNPGNGMVSFPVDHFSLHQGRRRGEVVNPPPGWADAQEPQVTDMRMCEDVAWPVITCGKFSTSANFSIGAGTTTSMSAGFGGQLELAYGVASGPLSAAIASIQAKAGVKFTFTAEGGIEAATTREVSGGATAGDTATSADCYSGTGVVRQVNNVSTITIAGIEMGTITKPQGVAHGFEGMNLDTNCECSDRGQQFMAPEGGPCP